MDMVTRLCELENVEIVACRALEVSFFVDGRDVTAPAGLAALQQQIGKTHDSAVGNGVVDVRGGAFGSEVVLVGHQDDDDIFSKPPRQRRHVPQDKLLLAEASGRRTLFLDVELTAMLSMVRRAWAAARPALATAECGHSSSPTALGFTPRSRPLRRVATCLSTQRFRMGSSALQESIS